MLAAHFGYEETLSLMLSMHPSYIDMQNKVYEHQFNTCISHLSVMLVVYMGFCVYRKVKQH